MKIALGDRGSHRLSPGWQRLIQTPCIANNNMLIVHVRVQVNPESVEGFKQATLENARNSVKEPGIARFEVIQNENEPTRFVLIEVYRTADAPARHKETAHYAAWREAVAPMMAEPRTSVKFRALFPEEAG